MKGLIISLVFAVLPVLAFGQSGTQPLKQSAGINPGTQQTAPVETGKEIPKVYRMSAAKDSLPLQPVPVVKEEPVTTQPKKMSSGIEPR